MGKKIHLLSPLPDLPPTLLDWTLFYSVMSAPVGKTLVVISGVLVLLNGTINIVHNTLAPWCSSSETQACVGPGE